VDLDLHGAEAEADAARDFITGQDQAQTRFVEMLTEDAPRARRLVAEDALEVLAHHCDAQFQQWLEVFFLRRVEAPVHDRSAAINRCGRRSGPAGTRATTGRCRPNRPWCRATTAADRRV